MPPAPLFDRVRDLLLGPLTRLVGLETTVRELRLALLQGSARHADPRSLVPHGYRVSSQNEEDGIIDEVFRRIGTTNRYFVEFGVGNGLENNTVSLLLTGWRGTWIEASQEAQDSIRKEFRGPLEDGRLSLKSSFVTAENIEAILGESGVPAEPDLLSIDIDRNDYWVWKAIGGFRPRVVVIEYNASLGRSARVVAPYDPGAAWDGTLGFGASLGALEELGRNKGYALVGCCLAGVNAFFVRADLVGDRFLEPYTAERHYEPPRYGATGAGHPVRWRRFDPT